MRILAFSDVHAPRYLHLLKTSLSKTTLESISAVLIAGDIVEKGDYRMCAPVEKLIRAYLPDVPIIAVFGNEDYPEIHDKLKDECSGIIWLDDDYIEIGSEKQLAVIGTTGVLDRPTRWQTRNVPQIREIYTERLNKISNLISKISNNNMKLLLTHYPPRCRTLVGEREEFWEEMSSRKLTELLQSKPVDVVIHGHLHESRVYRDIIGNTPVFNVALPAVKEVTVIQLQRTSLDYWLKP